MQTPRSYLLGSTAATLAAAVLSACSTLSSGMGGGDISVAGQPNTPVLFSWQSHDGGISGSLVATLPDATYQGRFVQITQETTSDSMAPMWNGWSAGWIDWQWGEPWPVTYDAPTFTRDYSGKVLANLQNPGGQNMRCRFVLDAPSSGLAGGGQGECQLPGGRQINAVIEPNG
jgi:hypothetical protein